MKNRNTLKQYGGVVIKLKTKHHLLRIFLIVLGIDVYKRQDDTRSILISSHISTDLEGLCDDLYMIDKGRIVLHEDMDTLLGQYGLLKMTREQYETVDKQYFLRKRKESYGYSILTNEKQFYLENYPQITMENGNIDDVIAMMVKGEAV